MPPSEAHDTAGANAWTSGSWDMGDEQSWTADPAAHDELSILRGDVDKIFSEEICTAALRGENLPTTDVDAMSQVTILCVVRGIRHRHGFAAELRNTVGCPIITRALNARAIMSNEIPDMSAPDDFPYCIWNPDVASEDTYRELAKRYPQMRYQIGRACAVAGYDGLHKELQLLPDIAIAEEARDSVMRANEEAESRSGSQAIFEHIVNQPVRWQVMNDYTTSVELESPLPARYGLNGDTAVVSTLKLKRSFLELRRQSRFNDDNTQLNGPAVIDQELAPCYFNITEDWNIDEYTSTANTGVHHEREVWSKRPMSEELQELLWNPLPLDLPWGDKDLLVLMAAYYGNVDRYARLRRPLPVSMAESNCIVRGIYHNTMFAKWLSLQPGADRYASAINARFIMNNDISRISDDTPDSDLPTQIWYPLRAHPETYLELALRKPTMTPAIARALIVADYQEAWDRIDVEPYYELMEEAKASPNPYYLETLKKRCAERGLDADVLECRYPEDLSVPIRALCERVTASLPASLSVESVPFDGAGPAIYSGIGVDASAVELFAAAPRDLRPPAGFDVVNLSQLYYEQRNAPPSQGEESHAYGRNGQMPRRGGRGNGCGIPWGNRWQSR